MRLTKNQKCKIHDFKKLVTHKICEWKYDDFEDRWEGSCGIEWCFSDGGLKENDVIYCPKCGKKAREVKP